MDFHGACSTEGKPQGAAVTATLNERTVGGNLREGLTVSERGEQHPEAAEATCLVGPHPHHPHIGVQHDVISNRATKLGLQRHCT